MTLACLEDQGHKVNSSTEHLLNRRLSAESLILKLTKSDTIFILVNVLQHQPNAGSLQSMVTIMCSSAITS